MPAGAYLFKIGDPDENVYVVQSGCLNVFITEPNGTMISLKYVKAGESVTSLLSFTDVLTVRQKFFIMANLNRHFNNFFLFFSKFRIQ